MGIQPTLWPCETMGVEHSYQWWTAWVRQEFNALTSDPYYVDQGMMVQVCGRCSATLGLSGVSSFTGLMQRMGSV